MNVLLTGAAGFIGSHLSERLLDAGHTVFSIDNFDSFYSREIKKTNLSKSLRSEKFTFFEGDINDIKSLVGNKIKADIVIHLAARAGVRPSIENPGSYIHSNINGTFQVLDWMKETGCKKMIFASSSSVYGNNKKVPFAETDPVDHPISPYAFTKKSCESLNHTFHHLYDFSIINLRFFTVFGPRQRPDLAIHKFFNHIYSNKPIDIYGDGSTGRDYTYIDDIINGLNASIELVTKQPKLFEIINLGNSKPVILKNLVEAIEEVSGRKAIRNFCPMQDGDVDFTYADISKAQRMIGFNPFVTLNDGLLNFKNWYENR